MSDFGSRWKNLGSFREGGQAHTFKVEDKTTADKKIYILKRLKNPKRSERFNREIEACLALDHPNILKIIDHGTLSDKRQKPYFVTNYCTPGNLDDHEMPPGSPLKTLELFRGICAGAAHAHDKGIVHRDLKPENILLTEDGTPVIADFGICFMDTDGNVDRLTATMEVAGSRWYCAPELRDGRVEAGISQAPADVYSLGKVLYWMLSGKKNFDREDHRLPRYRIGQDDEAEPAYELINELLDKTIIASSTQRIQNARSLLGEIDDLITIIRNGGHAISLQVPQRCIFCAKWRYQVIVNGLELSPQSANGQAQSLFGWASPKTTPLWLIMACDTCGNVQTFRPDLPEPRATQYAVSQINAKKERWTRKRNP